MVKESPKAIFEAACDAGCARCRLSPGQQLVTATLGGALFAIGGLLAIVVGHGSGDLLQANPGLAALVFGAVFPVGAVLAILTGAHLFPDNCGLAAPALLVGAIRPRELLRNWGLAYAGNFVGSVLVALFLAYWSGIVNINVGGFGQLLGGAAASIAEGKVSLGWGALILRGIGCNWLVCLAVWLAISADDIAGKILGIWWPIMAFAALGFEHSVANMFFIPLGMLNGADVTIADFLLSNLLPVTIGNVVGGAGFVGLVYWWLYGRD
jgi:formate/nitrite transporter